MHIVAFSCVFPPNQITSAEKQISAIEAGCPFCPVLHNLCFIISFVVKQQKSTCIWTTNQPAASLNVKHSKNENSLLLIVVKIIAKIGDYVAQLIWNLAGLGLENTNPIQQAG